MISGGVQGVGQMFRWMLLMLIAIPLLTGAVVGPAEAQSIDNRLRDIRVEGAQRIEADTVRSYMGIRRGDQISAGVLDKSLKALFATGMFADVNMRQVGRDVVVRVVENPIVALSGLIEATVGMERSSPSVSSLPLAQENKRKSESRTAKWNWIGPAVFNPDMGFSS